MFTISFNVSSREEADKILEKIFGPSTFKPVPAETLYENVKGPVTQKKIGEVLKGEKAKPVDLQTITDLAVEKVKAEKKPALAALLKEFGVPKLSALDKKDFADFYEKLQAI